MTMHGGVDLGRGALPRAEHAESATITTASMSTSPKPRGCS